MEISSPQVIDSLLAFEEFIAPVYNQGHQEQIAAGLTSLNIVEILVVQEQVIVQEIPQVSTDRRFNSSLGRCCRTDRFDITAAG